MPDHLLIRNLVRTQSHSFSHFFQICSGGLPGRVKVDRQDHDKQDHMDLHPNLHQETPTAGQHYQRTVGQDLKVQLKVLDQLQGQHSSIMDLSYPPGHPLLLGTVTELLHQLWTVTDHLVQPPLEVVVILIAMAHPVLLLLLQVEIKTRMDPQVHQLFRHTVYLGRAILQI